MKLLPYVDDKFVGRTGIKAFRIQICPKRREFVARYFLPTFVEKVENQIKSISVINASKLFYIVVVMQVLNLKNNFHE